MSSVVAVCNSDVKIHLMLPKNFPLSGFICIYSLELIYANFRSFRLSAPVQNQMIKIFLASNTHIWIDLGSYQLLVVSAIKLI